MKNVIENRLRDNGSAICYNYAIWLIKKKAKRNLQ